MTISVGVGEVRAVRREVVMAVDQALDIGHGTDARRHDDSGKGQCRKDTGGHGEPERDSGAANTAGRSAAWAERRRSLPECISTAEYPIPSSSQVTGSKGQIRPPVTVAAVANKAALKSVRTKPSQQAATIMTRRSGSLS